MSLAVSSNIVWYLWVSWVLLGIVAGLSASVIFRAGGYGIVSDAIVGIIGAIIGGFIASEYRIPSLLLSSVGAFILIALLHIVSRKKP